MTDLLARLGLVAALLLPPALASAQPRKVAAPEPRLLAVLPFEGQGLPSAHLELLEEVARTAAANQDPGQHLSVLTRENVLAVIQARKSGSDEAACAVEVGMELRADYLLSGTATTQGSTVLLNLKLFETRSAQLLAAERLEGRDAVGLEPQVGPAVGRMLGKVLGPPPTRVAEAPASPAAPAARARDTTPPRLAVLEPAVQRGFKLKRPDKRLRVRLAVTDEGGVYEVKANEVEARPGPDGSFVAEVPLAYGDNALVVSASDMAGNRAEERFVVAREAEAVAAAPAQPAEPGRGRYLALVIGIDAYSGSWPRLGNAVRDAQALAAELRDGYGFDPVVTLYNQEATRTAIIQKLEWLTAQARPDDSVLIYFSGHGLKSERTHQGYWVPVEAAGESVSALVSTADVQTFVGAIPARHTLLVADACFAGEIFRGSAESLPYEDSERYYREVARRASRQALTSGGLEPVMDGGREGHSIFAYYLLQSLRGAEGPRLDAGRLFERLKLPVSNNSEQTPILQPLKNTGDEGGQFVFVRRRR